MKTNKFNVGDIVKIKDNLRELIPDYIITKDEICKYTGTYQVVQDTLYFAHHQQHVYELNNGDGFAFWEAWLEEA